MLTYLFVVPKEYNISSSHDATTYQRNKRGSTVTRCEKHTISRRQSVSCDEENWSLFGFQKRSSFLVEGKMVASSTSSKTNAKQNAELD